MVFASEACKCRRKKKEYARKQKPCTPCSQASSSQEVIIRPYPDQCSVGQTLPEDLRGTVALRHRALIFLARRLLPFCNRKMSYNLKTSLWWCLMNRGYVLQLQLNSIYALRSGPDKLHDDEKTSDVLILFLTRVSGSDSEKDEEGKKPWEREEKKKLVGLRFEIQVRYVSSLK